MSHAELCMQEHIILDKRAASIKSRSRSKSQSQPAAGPAKYLADDTNGNPASQTCRGDSPDSRTRFADEPTQTNDFSIDVIASRRNSLTPKETASAIADEEALKDIDQLLVKRVLQLAVELETQARVLLMHTMPKGSRPEVLLRADMVRRMPSRAGPLLNFTFIAASES
jgi:potassium channel subfamily K